MVSEVAQRNDELQVVANTTLEHCTNLESKVSDMKKEIFEHSGQLAKARRHLRDVENVVLGVHFSLLFAFILA